MCKWKSKLLDNIHIFWQKDTLIRHQFTLSSLKNTSKGTKILITGTWLQIREIEFFVLASTRMTDEDLKSPACNKLGIV